MSQEDFKGLEKFETSMENMAWILVVGGGVWMTACLLFDGVFFDDDTLSSALFGFGMGCEAVGLWIVGRVHSSRQSR